MIRLLSRLARRESSRPTSSPHRFRAEMDALETRELLTFAINPKNVHVTPQILWPPNGQFVPVQISGTAIEFHYNGSTVKYDELPGPKIGQFRVTDEYRQYNPTGVFQPVHTTGNNFTFSFTVNLPAKRASEFAQGRRFFVAIGLKDSDGWNGRTMSVWVPQSLPPGFASTHTAALQRVVT